MTEPLLPITLEQAAAVGRFFGLAITAIDTTVRLDGSPERSQSRCAVRDATGRLFVIERLAQRQYAAKARIAHILNLLAAHGFDAAITYLPDVRGENVVRSAKRLWQMAPYVESLPVPRPGWVSEGWRGRAFAERLVDLRRVSACLDTQSLGPAFCLPAYIDHLMTAAARYNADIYISLEPIKSALAPLEQVHGALPTTFCHGDVHPLNTLWSAHGIRALIDWEFCGLKVSLYDVAALVGCVGIEQPSGLTGALVQALLTTLGGYRYADTHSWRWLPELVLAIRFGWMSEWLRKGDREIIALELDYMALLVARRERLRANWLAWVADDV